MKTYLIINLVILAIGGAVYGQISDDFEDGVIDTSKWVVGGQKRGYTGTPAGSWQWSNTEITASDGYFKSRVWGPYTGNTYGAEAWIRTTKDFRDGQDYLINFTWQPNFADSHYNIYYLQITDGYIPGNVLFHWQVDGEPGTTDLLWTQYPSGSSIHGWNFENQATPGKLNWSLEILASGIARLYNAPNKGGTLIREESLDTTKPWYFRLMVNDGTSAGFGAGDAWFNLYDFSDVSEPPGPQPEPWSFVQISDTHIGYEDADEALEAAVDEISNLSPAPDFVLVTGDIADFGCDKDNNCFNPNHYDTFNTIMESLDIPYYPIPGNHDWKSSKHKNLYDIECNNGLMCYTSKINKPTPIGTFPKSSSVGNYWFQHNEFVFVGLDTGWSNVDSSQAISDDQMDDLTWLSSMKEPKIVFMHHPADNVTLWAIKRIKGLFDTWCIENDVRVVIAGHTHHDDIGDLWGSDWNVGEETGYVQTPSCGKDDGDPQGYRIFDVIGGVVSARKVSTIQDTLDEMQRARAHSPVKLHAYDSQGGHVGVNPSGGIDREIPGSYYLPHYNMETEDGTTVYPEKILIFHPSDDYLYEIIGTEEGTYGLDITSVSGGDEIIFEATNIPTSPGARHVYAVNWEALSSGEEGVIIEIDNNGDGIFERTVIADENLTNAEFALQTKTVVDFDPDTLNLDSQGKFVTLYIELPQDCDVSKIDISSLKLNDTVAALSKPVAIGDYDSDGTPDLMVKFDRQQICEIFEEGVQTVNLTGRLEDGTPLAGMDIIRVLTSKGGKDNKGSKMAAPGSDMAGEGEVVAVQDENLGPTDDNAASEAFGPEEAIVFMLCETGTIIEELGPACFNSEESAIELANGIDFVFAMLDAGMYYEALDVLENDILQRTDGCANIGVPDENDWITSFEGQALLYPLVTETIELLESML